MSGIQTTNDQGFGTGEVKVSACPLPESMCDRYSQSLINDGVNITCEAPKHTGRDDWSLVLPRDEARKLAVALRKFYSDGEVPLGTKEYEGLLWSPCISQFIYKVPGLTNHPLIIDGFLVWEVEHVFLVSNSRDSTADHSSVDSRVPWWINEFMPARMKNAADWDRFWPERPADLGCMMTSTQANQLGDMIRNRADMSSYASKTSRGLLERCESEGMPPVEAALGVISAAKLAISFSTQTGPLETYDIVPDATGRLVQQDFKSTPRPPKVTAHCSSGYYTKTKGPDGMPLNIWRDGGTSKEALDKVLLELLDFCPAAIEALALSERQGVVWPKPVREILCTAHDIPRM